jgi:hypothetical protein
MEREVSYMKGGPSLDISDPNSVYTNFVSWKARAELIIARPLSKHSAASQAAHIRLQVNDDLMTHLQSIDATPAELKNPEYVLTAIEDYVKPQSIKIQSTQTLLTLKQGELTLMQ